MGKTVPSYRMAVEWEIDRWKGFRNALANEEEKQAFDEIMDMCRNLASAGSCACNPISLRLWQCRSFWLSKKRCEILSIKLSELLWEKICTQENNPNVRTNP